MTRQFKKTSIQLPAILMITTLSVGSLCAKDPRTSARDIHSRSGFTAAVAFRPDSREIAIGAQGFEFRAPALIEFRDVASGEKKSGISVGPAMGYQAVGCVAYSPIGNLFAYENTDRAIILYDPQTRTKKAFLVGHKKRVASFVFSSSGKYIASGSVDCQVGLWDLSACYYSRKTIVVEPVATLAGHTQTVSSVAFTPDEKYVVSGSLDHTVKVWDVPDGKLVATLNGHSKAVNAVAVSPDGRTIASGGLDRTVKFWEPLSGRELRTVRPGWNVYSVVFSPDGRIALSGTDSLKGDNIVLWDVATGERVGSLTTHNVRVRDLSFSPDGTMLAAAGITGVVKLWKVTDILP